MIYESMADKELCVQVGDDLVVEQVEPRRVQQARRLEVVEIEIGSRKPASAKSTLASNGPNGSEEESKSDWLALMIREILGKHSCFR
jgi:hypothetical protein